MGRGGRGREEEEVQCDVMDGCDVMDVVMDVVMDDDDDDVGV